MAIERSARGLDLYLDWNATTPPHPSVLTAMTEAAEQAWANPASVHQRGRIARSRVEALRERIAALLEVHRRDVVVTASGTEANNLALRHAPALVTSRLEHPSVTRVAEQLEAEGRTVRWLPVPESGQIQPDQVGVALEGLPKGSWVAVMAANHELGVIQRISEIAEVVHEQGAWLHVDAVQALGKISPDFFKAGDSLAIAAHKLRGPKSIGALAWREGGGPKPVLVGGAQERGLRPGTQDPVLAAGFLAALLRAVDGPTRYARIEALRDRLEQGIGGLGLRNGAREGRLPHVSNLSFPNWQGDELVAALDLRGIYVSSGSACSAGTTEASPVVTAVSGRERAASAVRFSLGEDTTLQDIDATIEVMHEILDRP